MLRKAIALTALVGMTAMVWATDPSEKGVTVSPLRIYSGGICAGAVQSLSKDLKEVHNSYLKLSFQNAMYVKENLGVFCDINWFLPGINPGADLGFDIFPITGSFRPFIGAGVGAQYFDRSKKFGDNIGPSGTVHIGFGLDLTDRVQMRVRVPYHIVLNNKNDQAAGVEVGFLFSGRFKNVKKLNYN
jgi:hypothetical protein